MFQRRCKSLVCGEEELNIVWVLTVHFRSWFIKIEFCFYFFFIIVHQQYGNGVQKHEKYGAWLYINQVNELKKNVQGILIGLKTRFYYFNYQWNRVRTRSIILHYNYGLCVFFTRSCVSGMRLSLLSKYFTDIFKRGGRHKWKI